MEITVKILTKELGTLGQQEQVRCELEMLRYGIPAIVHDDYWIYHLDIEDEDHDWALDMDNHIPAGQWGYCQGTETNPEAINL